MPLGGVVLGHPRVIGGDPVTTIVAIFPTNAVILNAGERPARRFVVEAFSLFYLRRGIGD